MCDELRLWHSDAQPQNSLCDICLSSSLSCRTPHPHPHPKTPTLTPDPAPYPETAQTVAQVEGPHIIASAPAAFEQKKSSRVWKEFCVGKIFTSCSYNNSFCSLLKPKATVMFVIAVGECVDNMGEFEVDPSENTLMLFAKVDRCLRVLEQVSALPAGHVLGRDAPASRAAKTSHLVVVVDMIPTLTRRMATQPQR